MARASSSAPYSRRQTTASGSRSPNTKRQAGVLTAVQQLQNSVGNQATLALLSAGPLQTKLRVGSADDSLEREADRVADRVVGDLPVPAISPIGNAAAQRQPIEDEEQTQLLQRQPEEEEEEEEVLQLQSRPEGLARKADSSGGSRRVPAKTAQSIQSQFGSGKPLASRERSYFEPRFGRDLGQTRIHTGPAAQEAADTIHARAFTLGREMFFARGEFQPDTTRGRKLLAHELTHTLQQRGGVPHAIQRKRKVKTAAAEKKKKTGDAHGIDYERLFKDKKLEIGVAIGAEFHSPEFLGIVKLLNGRGFKLTQDAPGKKTFTKKKMFQVPGKGAPVEIEIIVDVISEQAKDAKKSFGGFLSQKEITIYSGHARYGTGPDFDAKKSPGENFVIGVNSALHKAGKLEKGYDAKMNKILKDRKNDLEQISKAGKFDPKKYQVWFFNACTTLQYLDEIRGGLVTDKAGTKKSRADLRFFGTKETIVQDAIPILTGILDMQTMDEIIAAMHQYETGKKPKAGKSNIFFAD